MKRAGRALPWASGMLASGLAVVTGLSTRDLAAALAVVLIVVAALCWVIKDSARTRRLATLVRAWRDPSPRSQLPRARLEAAPAKQRRARATTAGSDPTPPAGGAPPTG
jgi:hypothetical protein